MANAVSDPGVWTLPPPLRVASPPPTPMQHYELMLLLDPQIADGDVGAVVDRAKKVLTDSGATIAKEEALGRRKLSYPINKARQGVYHVIEFDAPATTVAAADQAYRLDKQILRHLMVAAKVRTAADIEREQALRERIEARRRAAAVASAAAEQPKSETKPIPEQKVDVKELDEKLEKILGEEDIK